MSNEQEHNLQDELYQEVNEIKLQISNLRIKQGNTPQGNKTRAIAIALTHLETGVLWLESAGSIQS